MKKRRLFWHVFYYEEMDETVTRFVVGESTVNNEIHNFEDWAVEFKKSHILPSICTQPCSADQLCLYCRFTKQLDLQHLPEMVFPHNILKLRHKSGCSIEFNALEALRHVKTSREETFTIASAQAWRKAREDTGFVDKTVGNFDWTFRSNYSGTFEGWPPPEKTSVGIDTERLKQREEILLYRDLVLYEDELHDNGISLSSVRIRIMGWGFFILLRHFLRVDGVALCATDTRICHDFSSHYVTVEHTSRQGSIPELRLPLSVIKEPDEVTPLLPLTNSSIEKYCVPNI